MLTLHEQETVAPAAPEGNPTPALPPGWRVKVGRLQDRYAERFTAAAIGPTRTAYPVTDATYCCADAAYRDAAAYARELHATMSDAFGAVAEIGRLMNARRDEVARGRMIDAECVRRAELELSRHGGGLLERIAAAQVAADLPDEDDAGMDGESRGFDEAFSGGTR